MEKIFYADKSAFSSSIEAVEKIFREFFHIPAPIILRTENGKPYLENGELFFSVSHTKSMLFVAISDKNVGIDAENLLRKNPSPSLLKKFTLEERAEITSNEDFLRHWTAKESAIKYLGGTIAKDLKDLRFIQGKLRHEKVDLNVTATVFQLFKHIVTVCHENDFSKAEIVPLS